MCLTWLPEGVNSTMPRSALQKNASGVAMRMKIRQNKTPQLTNERVLHLFINLKDTFFDTNVGSRPNLVRIETRLALT